MLESYSILITCQRIGPSFLSKEFYCVWRGAGAFRPCFRKHKVKFFAFLRKRSGERSPLSAPLVIRLWLNGHGISRKRFCKKHLRKGSIKFAFYQNRFKLLLLLIFLMPVFTRGSYISFSIFIEIKLGQFCGYFRGNFQQRFFLLLTFLWFLTFIKCRWVAFAHVLHFPQVILSVAVGFKE